VLQTSWAGCWYNVISFEALKEADEAGVKARVNQFFILRLWLIETLINIIFKQTHLHWLVLGTASSANNHYAYQKQPVASLQPITRKLPSSIQARQEVPALYFLQLPCTQAKSHTSQNKEHGLAVAHLSTRVSLCVNMCLYVPVCQWVHVVAYIAWACASYGGSLGWEKGRDGRRVISSLFGHPPNFIFGSPGASK